MCRRFRGGTNKLQTSRIRPLMDTTHSRLLSSVAQDPGDLGLGWPLAAGIDHLLDHRPWPREQRLDLAARKIADPTLQAAPRRLVLGPGAILDALDFTRDDDAPGAHANSTIG